MTERFSQYTGYAEHNQPLTEAQAAFEDALQADGYERAVDCCPVDHGLFVGAVSAYDLVSDFLAEHPEFEEQEEELQQHAMEIGEVCNLYSQEDEARAEEAERAATAAEEAADEDNETP